MTAGSHWNAQYYNQNSSTQHAHALDVLKCYTFKGKEHILDVGCGDGKITADIARILPQGMIEGFDHSESMLNFAKSTFPEDEWPNLRFTLGDITQHAPSISFDMVVSFSCMHGIKNQLAALMNMKKSLKSGGHLLILTYGKDFFWDILKETTADKQWAAFFEGYENPYSLYDPTEYEALLKQAGFIPKRLEITRKITPFKGEEPFQKFLQSWMLHVRQLPDQLQMPFLSDLTSRYRAHIFVDENNVMHMPFSRFEVEASA